MRPGATFALAAVLALASYAIPLGAAEHDGHVADYIAARLDLMRQIETMTARAEELASGSTGVTDEMSKLGAGIAADLAAFGLLFPDNTNLLGGAPAPDGVTTTAVAAVWDDFAAFYAQSRAARDYAVQLSTANDVATYAEALTSLRGTCASCHETYVFYDPFAAVN
jgi:cytochrome c556